jgi:predicted alpha/beta hydrolase
MTQSIQSEAQRCVFELVPQVDSQTAQEIGNRIRKLNRQSLAIGVGGMVMQIVGSNIGGIAGMALSLLGLCSLFCGYGLYAKMKGRSPWWGVVGLFSCVGLIVLYFLPTECHNCHTEVKGKTCHECGAPCRC